MDGLLSSRVQARFRKIERLSARLTLPNSVVTAVAADLLRAPSTAAEESFE